MVEIEGDELLGFQFLYGKFPITMFVEKAEKY